MAKHHCSVVIPAKNAMPGLADVLKMVLAQETPWPFEIIVIDSGSQDETTNYVRSLPSVRLIEIPPESFGHGRTRNLGVSAADAEFVAFLTHDAVPTTDRWLVSLVESAEQDEKIAGVFGKHVAYETASPFIKKDLDQHFNSFLDQPLVVHRDLDTDRYANDQKWRQFLHFYSDNNSLLRKSVWEEIPYPDVEFAEDQLWAQAVIDAGYSKAYSPDAVVYHSHDYSPLEQLRRSFDESRNFKKYFGYELSPKLFPTIGSTACFCVQAFRENLDESRYGKVGLKHRVIRAGQRVGRVVGHFLGSNHKLLPASVADRISLDNRLFKSNSRVSISR